MATDDKKLVKLKTDRDAAIRTAEKAAYAYFCECPIGAARVQAGEVFDNVRTALRTGVPS